MSASAFGRDTSCLTELRTGRFVTGARLVGESAYRRLTTPRGMLRGGEEDQNFGLDLSELVGSVQTKAEAAALPGRIKTELAKDERIESVDVIVTETTSSAGGRRFRVDIRATTGEGPFTLAVSVSEVSVELIGLRTEV
jgi:hypothetical protein